MIIPKTATLDGRRRHDFQDLGHGVSQERWLSVWGFWSLRTGWLGGCCCRWFWGGGGGLVYCWGIGS